MLSQAKSGFIVESLTDGKRFPVFPHERVSTLEEISIFSTGEEDLPLKEVFKKMHDRLEGKSGPDAKTDAKDLKAFFEDAIPEYDPERVYVSDMKKAIAWYNLLLEKELLDFTEATETAEPETPPADPQVEQPAETSTETTPEEPA